MYFCWTGLAAGPCFLGTRTQLWELWKALPFMAIIRQDPKVGPGNFGNWLSRPQHSPVKPTDKQWIDIKTNNTQPNGFSLTFITTLFIQSPLTKIRLIKGDLGYGFTVVY